jgi:hypothetical protein
VKKIILTSLVGVILAGAAIAVASNSGDIRPLGGALDSFTWPDGTTAQTAYINGYGNGGAPMTVIQIKQTNGKTCYGVMSSSAAGVNLNCF